MFCVCSSDFGVNLNGESGGSQESAVVVEGAVLKQAAHQNVQIRTRSLFITLFIEEIILQLLEHIACVQIEHVEQLKEEAGLL